MSYLKESPSQTAGPYVHIGCKPSMAGLTGSQPDNEFQSKISGSISEVISLSLTLIDGAGEPVRDALLELWHNNAEFSAWYRCACDFSSASIDKDVAKPKADEAAAPYYHVWIAARGINLALNTRIYLPDENNAKDSLLQLAGNRADTLIATKTPAGYQHTIVLQGDNETVFLDI